MTKELLMAAGFRLAGVSLLFLALGSFVITGSATGQTPQAPVAKPAKPTAALIDFDRAPLVAVLEAELLGGDSAQWVERTEIAKLLDEQRLQKLFAADSGSERAQLGRLLKADLLVLVRSGVAEKVPYLDLVISEVSRGLRLIRRRVPLTTNAKQDVAELLKTVQQGIELQRQPIKAIYAVPPFVSDDLLSDFDELKGAFSLLIEQRMLEHPGVIVVELAEAEALAREIALTDGEAKVERQLPTYMLGQYRNEGRGAERTINIKLTLQQGTKTLGSNQLTMKPAEAPQYLREKTGNVVARLTGREVPPADSKLEAAQLARRSKDFSKLGLWEDALKLIQASLLLNPQQPDMHHDAVVANAKLAFGVGNFGVNKQGATRVDLAQKALGYYLRGLEHQATFYRIGGSARDYGLTGLIQGPNSLYSLQRVGITIWNNPEDAPELKAYMQTVRERQAEICLDLFRWQIANGQDEAASITLINAVMGMEPQPMYEIRRKVILEIQDRPHAMRRTILFANPMMHSLEYTEGKEFLARLEVDGNAEVKAGVAELRKQVKANRARFDASKPQFAEFKPVPATGGRQVRIDPIAIKLEQPEIGGHPPHEMTELEEIDGYFAAAPGLDVAWRVDSIYFLRKKGEAKRVWQSRADTRFSCLPGEFNPRLHSSVCCDGKYVWAACVRVKELPFLIVIDIESERSWKITQEDGLPVIENGFSQRMQQAITVAPISPGKVCVAGGYERGWVAMVTFSPEDGPKVDVFHEAKVQPKTNMPDQWQDPHLGFIPGHMFVLESPQGSLTAAETPAEKTAEKPVEKFVCIGRQCLDNEAGQHLLVVNAATKQVHVMRDSFAANRPPVAFWRHNGAVYYCDSRFPDFKRYALRRLSLPGPTVETEQELNVEGNVAVVGDDLHVFGNQWFLGKRGTETLQPATGLLPWSHMPSIQVGHLPAMRADAARLVILARSHHYGLFAHYVGAERYSTQIQWGLPGSPEMIAAEKEASVFASRPRKSPPTHSINQWGARVDHRTIRSQQIPIDGKTAWWDGCLAASPGLDVFWNDGTLYFMREKGRTKKIWETTVDGSRIAHPSEPRAKSGVCYDGKYVWATILHDADAPRIAVIDCESEQTWELAEANGLPTMNGKATLSLTALAPGKVCVAGGDRDRAWLAMVKFDATMGAKFEVFHEAKVATVADDPSQASNRAVAFEPTFMLTLTAPAGGNAAERRVLVGRKSSNAAITEQPLVVNPETLKVDILPDFLAGDRSSSAALLRKGSLYSVFPLKSEPHRICLHRLSVPALQWELMYDVPDEGAVVPLDEMFGLLGSSWWLLQANLGAQQSSGSKLHHMLGGSPWQYQYRWRLRPLGQTQHFPKLGHVAESHHYGLILCTFNSAEAGLTAAHVYPPPVPAP